MAGVVVAVQAQRLLTTNPPSVLPGLLLYVVAALLIAAGQRRGASGRRIVAGRAGRWRRQPIARWPLALAGLGALLVAAAIAARGAAGPARLLGLWTLGMLAWLAGFTLLDRRREALGRTVVRWDRLDAAVVVALAAAGLLLRAYDLDRVPYMLMGDEAEMGMWSLAAREGRLTDPFATGWLSHPNLFFFLQSTSLSWFGRASPFGIRFWPIVLGALTVPLTYALGRLLYTRHVALWGAVLLAAYHYHIHFSRMALNNIADSLFGVLLFALLAAAVQTRRWSLFAAAGLSLGLAQYFYMGTRLFPLVVAALGILAILGAPRRAWAVWREPALIFGASFLLAFGPLLSYYLVEPSAFGARLARDGILQSGWLTVQLAEGRSLLEIMADQLQRSALAFHAYADPSPFYATGKPLLTGLGALLMGLGFLLGLRHWRRPGYQLLYVWYLGAIAAGGALMVGPPLSPRFVGLGPVVCLFIAIGIEECLATVRARPRWVAQAVGTALVVMVVAGDLRFYFGSYREAQTIGSANNQVMSDLADYLRVQPAGTTIWMLAAPRFWLEREAITAFLVPTITDRHDVTDPLSDAAQVPEVDRGRLAVFIALSHRQEELRHIEDRYPGGRLEVVPAPRSEEQIVAYHVPPDGPQP